MVHTPRSRCARKMQRPKEQQNSDEEAFDISHKDGVARNSGLPLWQEQSGPNTFQSFCTPKGKTSIANGYARSLPGATLPLGLAREDAFASTCILKGALPPHLSPHGARLGARL